MRFELALTLAEHDGVTPLPTGVAAGLAAVVALGALLGRRRLPVGAAEGALVAALSGVVLLLFAVDSEGRIARSALGHVLTALAVLWYALSHIGARGPLSGLHRRDDVDADMSARERRDVPACAALVCGLAALVNSLVAPVDLTAVGWSPAATDMAVLLLLSAVVWVFSAGPWRAYPAITLVVCVLVQVFPRDALETQTATLGMALNVAGALSLLVVIGTILRHWWRRRRRWLRDPQGEKGIRPILSPEDLSRPVCLPKSAERQTGRTVKIGLIPFLLIGVGVLVGLGGVLLREAAFTPTAVLLAALTCLVIGHLRTWSAAGEIGLILVAEGIVTAALAWLQPGWSGALWGMALAGGYLLWLARFWDQQLNDGRPWTTAGRLIPTARRLSYAAATGTLGMAAGGYSTGDFQTQPVWIAAITLLLLLGYMSLLVRDGCEHRGPGAALAACLAVAAATGPAGGLLSELTGLAVLPVIVIAAGALLLALRVAAAARTSPAAPVYTAYIGGIVPVAALFALALGGFGVQSVAALLLAAAATGIRFVTFHASPRVVRAEPAGRV